MHHTATPNELTGFWLAVGSTLVNAGLGWILYIALEPWVRKRWPRLIVSWTRFVAMGAGDPLVGRDILYGVAFGGVLTSMTGLAVLLHGNDGRPVFPSLQPLEGVRAQMALLLASLPAAIFTSLLFLFMLFLLRLLFRREWIAGLVFAAIMVMVTAFASTTKAIDIPINALAFGVMAFAILRYGLVVVIVASATSQLIEAGAVIDFSSWYAGTAALPFVIVLLAALFGFRKSLAGRPLWNLD